MGLSQSKAYVRYTRSCEGSIREICVGSFAAHPLPWLGHNIKGSRSQR